MPDSEQSIGFLLNDVARLLRRNFNRRAQALGLSQAQSRVLAYLSRQQGANQVTLADGMDIQPMTLGRLIDGLEKAGLVVRRPDPRDRRAVQLFLTEAAQPLLARMWELAAETRAEALAGVSDAALAGLFETLSGMKRRLLDAEARAAARLTDEDVTGDG